MSASASSAPAPTFTCTILPGGHFYLDSLIGRTALLAHVSSHLTSALHALPVSVICGPPPPALDSVTYVHEMVEACALATPNAVAVVDAHSSRTYQQLVDEASLLAAWLVAHGAAPRTSVATLLPHAAQFLVAQLAVAMSAAACFALEGHFGPKMLNDLLGDTTPIAALAAPGTLAERLGAALPAGVSLLAVDADGGWKVAAGDARAAAPPRSAWPRAEPYDTGIITMTSGTTGKPKAIACPTVSYAVAVRAREHALPYAPADGGEGGHEAGREVEACNVMFVWEAMRPLCYGHVCLVVPDDIIVDTTRLGLYLQQHKATRVLSTPSLLSTLVETAADGSSSLALTLATLRVWLLCGEVVPGGLAAKVATHLPALRLVNDYSSWEGSDVALAPLPPPADSAAGSATRGSATRGSAAPVGRPLAGVCCAVVHPTTGVPVPTGGVGELYVSSPMVFTAYLGARALTADRLRPMPPAMQAACGVAASDAAMEYARLHATAAKRIDAAADADDTTADPANAEPPVDVSDDGAIVPLAYRTGDLCRLLPSGELQILGRADATIKIRGFKVGLPYVEGVLGGLPGVARVAVVPLLDESTNQPVALVAHLLPDASAAAAAAADERAWLHSVRDAARAELAAHSLPAHWMLTPELAALSDGESKKLDRKKLPKPKLGTSAGGAKPASAAPRLGGDASPAAAMEAAISPIWSEILGLGDGGYDRDDSFFDLGGHSLLANKLVAALSSRLSHLLGGRSVTVLDLFDAPSLSLLAAALAPKPIAEPITNNPRPMAPGGGRVDLAIIGAAGRFPGANSVDALWDMLRAGRDALRLWSPAELEAKGIGADVRTHPDFVPAAYLIDGAPNFDAGFWGIAPHEAKLMDPQHRVFMEVAWHAFERAGYAPRAGTPARTAVFASSGIDGYMVHHLDGEPLKDSLNPGDIFLGEVGSEKDYITTRVSYALDLMGPSLAVNSACSSALSAVALAAASLVSYQSDMALAGGSALSFPGTGYLFEDGLVNSIDGKVRPFDAKAHGTVFGDAVGAVVLRRLADALENDDNVMCVWRGCGLSNDGSRKAGYAAPGVAGQVACIRDALHQAGVTSAEVSYVECHATGTLVGDGIELRALTEAFVSSPGGSSLTSGHCAIGSIKGNIAHANAAAGVTGLIKAAMCLQNRTLVPTAHYETLNTKVVLDNGPFHVHDGGAAPWPAPAGGGPRIAGVSSFGIGGANVHAVLQEPPALSPPMTGSDPLAPAPCERSAHLLTLSAKSASSLARMAAELATFFADNPLSDPLPSLGRVAHTLHLGREAFAHRAVVVAATHDAAVEGLRSAAESAADDAAAGGLGTGRKAPHVLFIFPGQGSQCPRMGEGLYRAEPIYRKHVDRMCIALTPLLGFDLRTKLYPNGPGDDEKAAAYLKEFNAPLVTQPAIFVTELALGYTLVELGVKPAGLAGHSIGEFVAATLAGVFAEADALRLIATRARLSADDAPEGKMLAVNADEATATTAAAAEEGRVWMAVLNARGRQVIAGEVAAVDRVSAALTEQGVKNRPLPVNRAYHTPLMRSTQVELAKLLEGMPLHAPSVPLCCNGTGGWMEEATATDAQYWAAHVASTVRWADNMDTLAGAAPEASKPPSMVVEVGSGSSLAPLLAECTHANAEQLRTLTTLRHPKVHYADGLPDQESLGETLGALWEGGAQIDWKAYHRGERYIKLPLPTYSFEPEVHWINEDASMYVMPSAEALQAAQATIDAEAVVAEAAKVAAAAKAAEEPLAEPSLVRLRSATSADRKWVSAYCLAYAGGSTAAFSELARAAPEWMEVIGVEMPGKGELADAKWPADAGAAPGEGGEGGEGEDSPPGSSSGHSSIESSSRRPSLDDEATRSEKANKLEREMMSKLADRLAADAAGSSLVLIGWSMGGMLAAELALMLQARGCPPQMLHVAGRMAPGSFIAAGDDVDKYLLASDEMKATEAWRDWLLPMLMSDLRADARAEQRVAAAWSDAIAKAGDGKPPLDCLIQVCAGDADAAFPPDAIAAWRPLSSKRFESHVLSGGHDILQRCTIELLRHISRALLPSTPLYAVEWRTLAASAAADEPPAHLASSAAPLTWHRITGVVDEEAPAAPASSADDTPPPSPEAAAADALIDRFEVALKSPLGLVLYVPSEEGVVEQEGQCWEFITIVQKLAAKGASGRLVLACPASATCSALVAGASKAVPLEFPEIMVQRVHMPPAIDLLQSGGAFGGIEAMSRAYLTWIATIAATHLSETDLWLDPQSPHALRVPRLAPCRALPPTSAPAIDPNANYLITGGTGGVGGALIAWLLYEQNVPAENVILISRRDFTSPHEGVRTVKADVSSAAALSQSAELCALDDIGGIFHLAGVLDDGLLVNMTSERLKKAVAPKAGVLSLLELCQAQRWQPRWLVAASSTSSLLGYAGQSNYCAANGLLDHLATFGLPRHLRQRAHGDAPSAPHVLTLNFGPWGEVGMAREGTKAHQLSLQSGELPMASSAAISCIAEALRQLRAGVASAELGGTGTRAPHEPLGGTNLQFAVADVEWWRSPWPSHPLLQGVMHRLAPPPAEVDEPEEEEEEEEEAPRAASKKKRRKKAAAAGGAGKAGEQQGASGAAVAGGGGLGHERVEEFLKGRMSVWQPALPLGELGLDSLDLVQLRNGFQKKFKVAVPMATFTNAQQTLSELMGKLATKG